MPTVHPVALAIFGLASCLGLVACAQPHARAAQDDTGVDAPALARISGTIIHPAHAVPAMRICALSDKTAATPAPDRCMETPAGTDHYTLDGLRAGTYQVVAKVDDAGNPVGGHVRPVQCIRAPCPGMLAEVTLAAGEHREGVDLNGFYPQRTDFPALP